MGRKQALRIIHILNKEKIPAILLKEPLLGERIYQKEGIRGPSKDIDLFIRYPDLPPAERLLAGIGYRVMHYHYQWLERSMAQVECVNLNQEMRIELHWRPFHSYEWSILPLSLYWDNAITVDLDGVRVRFLSNDMLFIYLCLLICKETERGSRIKYLLDLHFFLLRYKEALDYSHLEDIISGYGLKPYLSFCLDGLDEGFELSQGLRGKLLDAVKTSGLNKIISKMVMDKKQEMTRKGSSKLKQDIINLFLFSEGSFWVMVNKIYLTCKSSYLRFLERKCLKPSLNGLIGHFLGLYKSL